MYRNIFCLIYYISENRGKKRGLWLSQASNKLIGVRMYQLCQLTMCVVYVHYDGVRFSAHVYQT